MPAKAREERSTELELVRRVIEPKTGNLKPALARYLLTLHFSESDKARVSELAQRNNNGELSRREKEELDSYIKVGHWLAWLHAKARISLKKHAARGAHA